ncbi:glycosyl hydrolase 115 family protein [Sphingopyxis sp.]|uniref:glycosyl hydrolase 115 family protein n=1 Tax=Sphingopyxis sp. TaxID=1908224 RepID=UPI002B47C317|nr:glycosyl hydrolase 115 family protein [Sphingopyxis sp.]HJS11865.1 glycosyl hydrolase 115 family protein [Sphingopyxis sp.]
MIRHALFLLAGLVATPLHAAGWVRTHGGAGALAIAANGQAAQIVVDPQDHAVVAIAGADLREDLATVTGARLGSDTQIWLGTLGRNAAIDRLAAERRIDVTKLKGAWESFLIASVDRPAPGIAKALVIVGSDRRGTAYGAYELSRAIGVSPWNWWADVAPARRPNLFVAAGTRRFGPPAVKYRGIFINDEDWGLHPWAATSFEPEAKGMGPRSYARLFELLLRLKANTLWPAMHKVTPAFNANPENAALADRHAIVMGSSHAEPMLRNNVGEWRAPAERFNYALNPEGVADYWRARIQSNARYESIWTLGMRGIHDSGIVGASTMEERKALLARIIADQRALLRGAVIEDAPQVFTPYKEVLDIYSAGLAIPDDVTLMWPDDNFGYIRRLPQPAERGRSGGHGVYYHLSYLGAPLSYLWLSTTPPALIGEEMGRAFDLGARTMWMANVGDLKPAELATDYFLSLAWDVRSTRQRGVDGFVRQWAAENIDAALAPEIAAIMAEHHRLNFERRPEHLQWWRTGEKVRGSPYGPAEAAGRMAAFDALVARMQRVAQRVPAHRTDAFFELVAYPVEAAAMANARLFASEAHDRLRDADFAAAMVQARSAHAADQRIRALTDGYGQVAGGKWRRLMTVEPADGQWKSYRAMPPILPAMPSGAAALAALPRGGAATPQVAIEAEQAAGSWRRVDGLGRNGALIASASGRAVSGNLTFTLPPGRWRLSAMLVPTYPDTASGPLTLDLMLDGRAFSIRIARNTGDAAWSQAVLDNQISMPIGETIRGGTHRLTLSASEGGVLVDRFVAVPAQE